MTAPVRSGGAVDGISESQVVTQAVLSFSVPQMHVVKNYMADQLEGVNPPLLLGIWGPKGCGKTFQTELALKKLGVEPVVMSAGELEHEWAGTPGRLIRLVTIDLEFNLLSPGFSTQPCETTG